MCLIWSVILLQMIGNWTLGSIIYLASLMIECDIVTDDRELDTGVHHLPSQSHDRL